MRIRYLLILFLTLTIKVSEAQITGSSFAANVDFSTGTGTTTPARLAILDLNNDGKPEVVVPNTGNSTVSVFRNVSTSTGWYSTSFVTQSPISVSANVQGVVLADMDGDGKPDLITTHGNLAGTGGGSTQIFVYLNGSSTGGSIGFFTGTGFTVATGTGSGNPASAVAADIDGDGKLDLVIGNYGNGTTSTGSIVVLRNTSSGTGSVSFVASSTYTTNINTPYNVKVADFDGDGKLDIVASCFLASGYISVYRNTSTSGSITLTPVNTFTAGTNPEYVDVGDIDGDGKPDIVVSNYGSANVSAYRNTSTGTGSISFASAVNFTTGTNPAGVNLTDLDGDGKPDLAVLSRNSGTLGLYRNTATSGSINSSSFASVVNYSTNSSPTFIATADLDGDTKPEIITSNQGTSSNISVFRNQNLAPKPTTAASNLSFSGISATTVTVSFTKGNGSKRLVLAKSLSAVNSAPSDSAGYSANSVFGSGAQIGSGNYVVYSDTGSSVNITGLTSGNSYYFTVFEYNGTGPYSSYLTSSTLSGSQIVSGNIFYSKSSGALNVLGTWGTNTDGTGTAPTSFSNSNSFYFVQNNSSPSLSASWTVSGSGSLVVFGDGTNAFNLIIPSSYTLTADTISVRSSITFTIQGTLAVNRSYFDVSSTAQFIGTSAQNVPHGNYYTLIMTSGAKTLTGNVTVRNLMNMGTNITVSPYVLTLGTSATSAGTLTRTGGTIIGTFTRWFAASTTSGSTGLFPIGTSSYYRPIEFDYTSAPSAGGSLTASFISSDPGNTGLPLYDFTIAQSEFLDQEGIDGYWHVLNSGVTGGTYSVIATATSFTNVSSAASPGYSDLRLIRRSTSSSAWTLPGTAVVTTGSGSVPVLSRTGITANGGDFGISSDHTINSLPVKLIILSVNQKLTNAMLTWETASEISSDHFTISRSTDCKIWNEIGTVAAAGNSIDVRSYSFVDPVKILIAQNVKTVYYYLKQYDKNGAVTNSNIITLDLKQSLNTITLYPLPLSSILTASSNNGEVVSQIIIYDISGRELLSAANGQLDVSSLASGIYIAKITTDKEVYTQKINK